jgi:beta-galactosidase
MARAPWNDPAVLSLGRLPMTGVPHDTDLVDLDGTWRFQLLRSPEDAVDPDGWRTIEVPGCWTMQDTWDRPAHTNVTMPFTEKPPRTPALNPTGVYERSFHVPAGWLDRRVVLHVGAAESVLVVEVNHRPVGLSKDSHLAAEFDVTDHLVDGENIVRLTVVKWSDATFVEDQDQWWHGGITRSVLLYSTGQTYLASLAVDVGLDVETSTGTLALDVRVGWKDDVPEAGWRLVAEVDGHPEPLSADILHEMPPGSLVDQLLDKGPPRRGSQDIVSLAAAGALHTEADRERWRRTEPLVRPAGVGRVRLRARVPDVDAWSSEAPNLYDLTLSLISPDGSVAEQVHRRIGFRSVEVRGAELLINGRPVLIRGVNRHDFDPLTGRAVAKAELRADVVAIKQWGFNAVRTSHYPNDPAFLDACDAIGLYVIDEADIEAHAYYDVLCDDPTYRAAFLERAARMVERDRHHPSVIAWSLGNESGSGANHHAAAGWIRHADPSRPLHYEGAIHFDWDSGRELTDLVCPMYPPIVALTSYAHAQAGRQARPVVMCEFSFSLGNSNGCLSDYWDAIEATPGLQGGFIWEWRDHGLRQALPDGTVRYAYGGDFGDEPNDGVFSADGITFPDRRPKPALFEHHHLASPVRIVSDAAEVRGGLIRLSSTRDFLDTSWLDMSWELSRDGLQVALGSIDVPPIRPGESEDGHLEGFAAPPDDGSEYWLTARFRTAEATRWSPAQHEVGWGQIPLPPAARAHPTPRRKDPWTDTVDVDGEGRLRHPALAAPPALSLWRAPTDNDEIGGLADLWHEWGLESLEQRVDSVRRRPGGVTVRSTWTTATGITIGHVRRVSANGLRTRVDEAVLVPEELADLPRVGTALHLGPEYDSLEWFGRGPHETYPDRARGAAVGRWVGTVQEQLTPYLRPQECGGHADTRWVRLSAPDRDVRIDVGTPSQVSVLPVTAHDLAAAAHPDELPSRAGTFVHLDGAHRGVGTAACGPDTLAEYVIRPGIHRWQWTISTFPREPRAER